MHSFMNFFAFFKMKWSTELYIFVLRSFNYLTELEWMRPKKKLLFWSFIQSTRLIQMHDKNEFFLFVLLNRLYNKSRDNKKEWFSLLICIKIDSLKPAQQKECKYKKFGYNVALWYCYDMDEINQSINESF